MRIALTVLLLAFALTGCDVLYPDPVARINLSPEAQRHCEYIGQMHGSDGYGGLGPRAACMRYVRDTGNLPPGI